MRRILICALVALAGCGSLWRHGLAGLTGKEVELGHSAQAEAYNHFLAATMYEKKGELPEAIKEMRKACDLAPQSRTLTGRLIREYVRNQDFENARVVAERVVSQNPEDANLRIVLGEIYHQLGEYDKAVDTFEQAIAIDPENVLGYGALASMQESANDSVAAVDIYQRLAAQHPDSAGIHFQLGLSLARVNDMAAARTELERALQLKPNLPRAHFMLGIILLEAGELDAAIKELGAYVKMAPDDVRARENLAGALARAKRYPESIEQLREILAGKNAEPRHNIEIMYVMIRAGQFADSETMIPATAAPAFGSLLRAFARKGQEQPDTPILETLDAIDTDIENECTTFLNELLQLFGKEDAGEFFISALQAARAEGIQSRVVDVVLARTLIALNRNEEAEAVLLAALKKFGDDKSLHYHLAVVYENLKRVPETEQHLKAYLKLKPDDPEVLNFLGYLYADHNMKLDEAEALLKRALEIQPDSGFYMDSLGWVYYRKGDADRAIEYIRKAIAAMDNDDAELRNHLGDAYLLKGDTDKALAEWKRARRLNPKLEGIEEKIKQHQK